MAVAAHGYVRATADVDFVALTSLSEVQRRLRRAGIESAIHRDDFDCLTGILDGVRFDVLPLLLGVDLDRTFELILRSGRVRVIDLDGLIG
ncbi:MAG TPA: hypothetical protein VF310_03475, partial [Vicinamibacteria bacterium]